ncbi:MAG TPA: 4Fe-4S binding protein [Spirochaetota bacterium]|nr:4Fe-4S binding protein [Spirochaetota bacterium]HPU87104.1 4Fe-4S binding protein [Spirochaetota bacterium]
MGAIEQKGHNAPTVDQALCTRCGLCTKGCPYQAFIAMKDH